MQEILVPWAAWYRETPFKMEFPDHWEVAVHHLRGGAGHRRRGNSPGTARDHRRAAAARVRPRPVFGGHPR